MIIPTRVRNGKMRGVWIGSALSFTFLQKVEKK